MLNQTSNINGDGCNGGIIVGIVVILITIAILVFFIARAGNFAKKMKTIQKGMSYSEVKSILGEPWDSNSAEGITTATWKRAVIRGHTNIYTITFKNDKVISISGIHNCN